MGICPGNTGGQPALVNQETALFFPGLDNVLINLGRRAGVQTIRGSSRKLIRVMLEKRNMAITPLLLIGEA